jgi:hypothetical protein
MPTGALKTEDVVVRSLEQKFVYLWGEVHQETRESPLVIALNEVLVLAGIEYLQEFQGFVYFFGNVAATRRIFAVLRDRVAIEVIP